LPIAAVSALAAVPDAAPGAYTGRRRALVVPARRAWAPAHSSVGYTPRTMRPTGVKLIAQNKKAYHDYHIEETVEAGIALTGTEVKSLRAGRVNLRDSYAAVEKGEVFLIGTHISPYEQGNIFNHDPLRSRKLLLHAHEIRRLYGKVQMDGYTLVPTKIYFKDGRVKVEIGLAKGKTTYDKRQTLAKKEAQRDMERAFRSRGGDE
jgi:SsrA-binding protein